MKLVVLIFAVTFGFNVNADIGAISKDLKRSDFAYAQDTFVIYGVCAAGEVYPNRNCVNQKKTISLPRAEYETKIAQLYDTSRDIEWIEYYKKQLANWESVRDDYQNVQIPKAKDEIANLEKELKNPDLTENQKKILESQLASAKYKLEVLGYRLRDAIIEIGKQNEQIRKHQSQKEQKEQEAARVIPAALDALDSTSVAVVDEGNELEKVMKPLREEYQNFQKLGYCVGQVCNSAFNTGRSRWGEDRPEESFSARYFMINENTAAGWVGYFYPRSTFKWDQSQHLPQSKMNSTYFHLDPVDKASYPDGKADISFEVFTMKIYEKNLVRVFRLTNNTRPYDLNIGVYIDCVSTGCTVAYGNNLEEVLKTLNHWGVKSIPEELRNPIYY